MWPLIIGAVSQATDPAKKLADDYCAYVISQGFNVNYDAVYSIYKYEYLQDTAKNTLLDWFDFRTVEGGICTELYSLVGNYKKIQFKSAITIVNEFPISGGFCPENLFDFDNSIKIIEKIKFGLKSPTNFYKYYNYDSNNTLSMYLRVRPDNKLELTKYSAFDGLGYVTGLNQIHENAIYNVECYIDESDNDVKIQSELGSNNRQVHKPWKNMSGNGRWYPYNQYASSCNLKIYRL